MLKQAAYFLAVFIFLAGVFVLGERSISPVFQCCIEQDKNTDTKAAAEKNPPAFGTTISAYFRCSGEFIESHNGGITALATIIIAAFTGTLWFATNQQATLTRQSIDLARKEFISSQRPRLRVRNIIVWNSPPSLHPRLRNDFFTAGEIPQVQFYVANVGGTDAMIAGALAIVYKSRDGLPMKRPYEGNSGNLSLPQSPIGPGQSVPFQFKSDEAIGHGAETIGSNVVQKLRLFVMGWVEYRDDIGIIRRTAFCREFERGPWDYGGFGRVENEDYEHEE
jgi:hypothetical protein